MKIRLENITFGYTDEKNILENFNLTINDEKMIAVIGHNGSGKSTVAKTIMGLLPVSKGHIYIDDEEMTEKTVDKIRLKLAIIFQNPDNQFVGVTVRDDIAFGLENRCIDHDEMVRRIDKYLALVDMSDFANANPEELSGGQKQRVAIAGALAMDTDLLIFDESTSMLDPKGTKEVNDIINKIRKETNKTIIVITHDLNECLQADRVIVMNKGKIVLDDTPMNVFKQQEILEASSLKTIDSVRLINELKNKSYPNKKQIEEKLWELTFKM